MLRWTQWLDGNFYKPAKELRRIEIEHITEEHWGGIEIHHQEQAHTKKKQKHNASRIMNAPGETHARHIPGYLQKIRNFHTIGKIGKTHPEVNKWIAQDYTHREIEHAVKTLKFQKAHGNDGVREEASKATIKWIAQPIATLLNRIKNDQGPPTSWKEGAIVHISD